MLTNNVQINSKNNSTMKRPRFQQKIASFRCASTMHTLQYMHEFNLGLGMKNRQTGNQKSESNKVHFTERLAIYLAWFYSLLGLTKNSFAVSCDIFLLFISPYQPTTKIQLTNYGLRIAWFWPRKPSLILFISISVYNMTKNQKVEL